MTNRENTDGPLHSAVDEGEIFISHYPKISRDSHVQIDPENDGVRLNLFLCKFRHVGQSSSFDAFKKIHQGITKFLSLYNI